MSTHELAFPGCPASPLAHYLKGLAILRLVTEQKDQGARGWWGEDGFVLRSDLTREETERFFLEEYEPTPIVAPWNGGSGFYPGDKKGRKILDAVTDARASRLRAYGDAIARATEALAAVGPTAKPDRANKERLLLQCRSVFPDREIRWLNAAFALTVGGPKAPPLLGTGGNDGRLEFTTNFMDMVLAVIDPDTGAATPRASSWLRQALWGEPVADLMSDQAIGQFHPGAAGGANMTAGFDAKSLTNPWDFVFMLEGALLFAAATTRRLEQAGPGTLSYPFTVHTTGAGAGTIATNDAGSSRAEMWLPLWDRPAGLAEISALLSEGRATVGRRQARDGVDFARAVASLSVDRGIDAFERYGFMERNGLAYLAVPLGRWEVSPRPNVDLLGEVDAWLGRFQRVAQDDRAPNSFRRAANRIEAAVMSVCRSPSPQRWQDLLSALGESEATMVACPQATLGGDGRPSLRPLPRLSPRWLAVCDDGSPELRLAAGLASIGSAREGIGPLRSNMIPLEPQTTPRFNEGAHMRDNAVVWSDADLADNMIAVLQRRCMDASRLGLDGLPLSAALGVSLEDVSLFIAGMVDDRRVSRLLWGLNAVAWKHARPTRHPDVSSPPLPAAYALLKLLFTPAGLALEPGGDVVRIPYTPSVLHLAAAGRLSEATRAAARRLRGSGLQPVVDAVTEPPEVRRRIAAALLFPLSDRDVHVLSRRVLRLPATAETS